MFAVDVWGGGWKRWYNWTEWRREAGEGRQRWWWWRRCGTHHDANSPFGSHKSLPPYLIIVSFHTHIYFSFFKPFQPVTNVYIYSGSNLEFLSRNLLLGTSDNWGGKREREIHSLVSVVVYTDLSGLWGRSGRLVTGWHWKDRIATKTRILSHIRNVTVFVLAESDERIWLGGPRREWGLRKRNITETVFVKVMRREWKE